jgi:RES domain
MLVCPECFGHAGLRKRIVDARRTESPGPCNFHPRRKGISIETLAYIVDPVFRENFGGGIPDTFHPRGSDLNEVLHEITDAEDDDILRALADQLMEDDEFDPRDGGEPFYSDEYDYYRDRSFLREHDRLWSRFGRSLLHEQRFFNPDARTLIEKIFADIHQQRDADRQGPVYMIEPGEPRSSFVRARQVSSPDQQKLFKTDVAKELGPPPERLRRPGRLNASGISAFYAAFETETCVAELRPAVGSTVAFAAFRITEPICVLDTTRFGEKPKEIDIYAAGAQRRAAQWRFMRTFMDEIGRPISPGDEHLDYVTTQAVAEYLLHHHHFTFGGKRRTIDAIIYHSAQNTDGKNIAILGQAAIVGPKELPRRSSEPARTGSFDPFDLFGADNTDLHPRIVPVADSFRVRRIIGATFGTADLPDTQESPELEDHDFDGPGFA